MKSKITPDFLNSSFNTRMILRLFSQGTGLRAQIGSEEKKTPDSHFHSLTALWWFSMITYSGKYRVTRTEQKSKKLAKTMSHKREQYLIIKYVRCKNFLIRWVGKRSKA